MAQTAKTTRKKATSPNGPSTGSSSSSNSGSARRSSSRTRSNGSASRTRKPASTSAKKSSSTSARSKPRSNTQSRNGSGSVFGSAVEQTKGAAQVISEAVSKAKTPLIVGGTALVGAAAGAVIKDRFATKRSKNPLNRLRGVSLPRPTTKLNLSELDLDKVKSTAERVSAYGQQASDIATAVQKTRKKNKT
jgi:hypothetical protein